MTKSDVIRAWKDPAYRASLTDDQRSALPANPAGAIELTEAELTGVGGGGSNNLYCVRQFAAINLNVSISCPFVVDYGKILTNPVGKAAPSGLTLQR